MNKTEPISYKIISILFAAFIGGIYWSTVRPSGYGSGPSLGLIWGLLWILLMWFSLDRNKKDKGYPSHALYILLIFAISFSVSGTQGYGQFNQWIRGRFYFETATESFTTISPIYGFYHLFICGLTWGGFPSLFIVWLLQTENNIKHWLQRIIVAVVGYIFFQLLIYLLPELFLPLYSEGHYSNLIICPDCQRTIDTAGNTYGYLGIFLFLSIHTYLKERDSAKTIVPIALGFAITFSFGGLLHMGEYVSGYDNVPWWKLWEFTCGFGGGVSLFSVFWFLHDRGVLERFVNKSLKADALEYWPGFWLPFFICIGELSRDRLHQIAKLYNILYGIDFRDQFLYVEISAILVTLLFFIVKVIKNVNDQQNLSILTIKKPSRMFLIIYSSFFWLMMLRWIIVPLTLENNITSILAITSYILSLVCYAIMKKIRRNGKKI